VGKEVANSIRGAILDGKMQVIPVRRGYWGRKIGTLVSEFASVSLYEHCNAVPGGPMYVISSWYLSAPSCIPEVGLSEFALVYYLLFLQEQIKDHHHLCLSLFIALIQVSYSSSVLCYLLNLLFSFSLSLSLLLSSAAQVFPTRCPTRSTASAALCTSAWCPRPVVPGSWRPPWRKRS
jgi:hypothetical protein